MKIPLPDITKRNLLKPKEVEEKDETDQEELTPAEEVEVEDIQPDPEEMSDEEHKILMLASYADMFNSRLEGIEQSICSMCDSLAQINDKEYPITEIPEDVKINNLNEITEHLKDMKWEVSVSNLDKLPNEIKKVESKISDLISLVSTKLTELLNKQEMPEIEDVFIGVDYEYKDGKRSKVIEHYASGDRIYPIIRNKDGFIVSIKEEYA